LLFPNGRSTVLPAGFDILLEGMPVVSSRGYLGYCTVVLFRIGEGWALFDTGHYNDRHLLLEALSVRNLHPEDIHHVVLSHLHFDHVLNLPLFKNAEIYLSEAEVHHAESVSSGAVTDHSIVDCWAALIARRKLTLINDPVEVGKGLRLSVKPGHTPGCLVLLYDGPDGRASVCGDALKNAWEAVTGEAVMALAGHERARSSIRELVEADRVIVPGHDRPFLMKEGVPKFLKPCQWELRADWYPQPRGRVFLSLSSRADPLDMPSEKQAKPRIDETPGC
jgi:N-acyl homoserine lactone hydrolase